MYIFAEPVTEDQVAEVQSANAAKIQEFERNILGLSHGEEFESGSESEATQEDDGKWENIQAEVQKEMDKDELSLDDPSQDQEVEEAEDLDVEDNGHVSDIQGIFEEGPLYANKRSAEADGDATAPAVGSEDGDVEGGEDDADDEAGADSDEQDLVHEREEDQEVDEAENVEVEETDQGQENQELTEGEEAHDAENSSGEEGLMEDSIAEKQAFDQDIVPASEDEAEAKDNLDRPTENDIASSGDASNNESSGGEAKPTATQDTTKSLSMKELKEKARADYIPPVGEEQSDFQTEADQPFLDAINGEVPQVNEATEDAPDILAMTLTLRNKVNGQYTLRPEGLTDKDKWSIEYSLIEVPTQRRARALYEACQSRRKKKMDTPLVPEDAETINLYIQNLRKMSRKGREWRKEQDKKDSENSVQVLGQELVQDAGEGDSVYQEPEA